MVRCNCTLGGSSLFKYLTPIIGTVFLVMLWIGFKSYTDPIFARNSVATLRSFEVNGDRQWILARGCNRDNPVVLFLHGGPGMPAMFTAHVFQRSLERDFVVAHWDQRGAGKSFDAALDPATMTMTQMLSDAEYVVDQLRGEFGVEKVILVGHSHGTYFGALLAQARPDLFHAYVGLGQIGDPARERAVQNSIIAEYFQYRVETMPEITAANRETLLFQIGGEIASAQSMWPLIRMGVTAPEYSFRDVMNVAKGPQFAQAHLRYDVAGDFASPPLKFDIPVYVAMGDQDAVTPVSLAQEWFDKVEAPQKRFVVFDDAAHFPHVEQPEAFASLLSTVRREMALKSTTPNTEVIPIPRFGRQCQ